jgi:hypothetical protein
MDHTRRLLLNAGAAAGAAALLASAGATGDAAPAATAVAGPTPGKPGDFDFLAGSWRIKQRRLPPGAKDWDVFEGEATCWSILGGVISIEELRIPARNFSGMGLRSLDVTNRVWYDYWVNSRSGVLGTAGVAGSFENGAGVFISDDVDGDNKPIKVRGLWDRITPNSCRWSQSVSRDGGKTWDDNWVMEWSRVAR